MKCGAAGCGLQATPEPGEVPWVTQGNKGWTDIPWSWGVSLAAVLDSDQFRNFWVSQWGVVGMGVDAVTSQSTFIVHPKYFIWNEFLLSYRSEDWCVSA